MRIHYFQHVPFEGPASIEQWAASRNHTMTGTHFYKADALLAMNEIDCLIVMGGPMNIYEEDQYPWLREEKGFIQQAIEANKIVLGICLGGQLIADVLGGKVYRGENKEIGWLSAHITQEARQSELFNFLPEQVRVFQWHGDTWHHPKDSLHLAWSEGCKNQAFLYKDRVVGLQFHLESTRESIQKLVENCRGEMIHGKYVQSEHRILSVEDDYFVQTNQVMFELLDRLSRKHI